MSSKTKGDYFEKKAISFLEDNGFKIVDVNFYAKKLGEIDIVATKDEIYHFVEVKSGESFDAVYNITPSKISKLKRSIDYYLQKKHLDVFFVIDAIIFHQEELEYLENITF